MNNPNVKSKRNALLGALFCAAQERGIPEEQLRDEIAPGLIGRRLSAANEEQIRLVLERVAGPKQRVRSAECGVRNEQQNKYPSSLEGLRREIEDLARERWGESWEESLNALVRRFGVERRQWLDVSHGRAVKAALLRMRGQDHVTTEGTEDSEIPF